MHPFHLFALLAIGSAAHAAPQSSLVVHDPLPSDTDGGLTLITPPVDSCGTAVTEARHYAVTDPSVYAKGRLLVFLPGTGGEPLNASDFLDQAAESGFHVIGLAYWNKVPIGAPCALGSQGVSIPCISTSAPTADCAGAARQDVVEGDGDFELFSGVDVTAGNSIVFRLTTALDYLDAQYPSERWGQFLDGGAVDWGKVTIAGFSQGSGHAAYLAKNLYEVERVMLFAGPADAAFDPLNPGEDPAAWVAASNFTTDGGRFFGLIHEDDALAGGSCTSLSTGAAGHTIKNWGPEGLGFLTSCPSVVGLPFTPPSTPERFFASDHCLPANPCDDTGTKISCGVPPHGAPIKNWPCGDNGYAEDVWPYLGLDAALAEPFGSSGCSGVVLAAQTKPILGADFTFTISGAPAHQLMVLRGSDPVAPWSGPDGCTVMVSPSALEILQFTTDPSGNATVDVPISGSTTPGTVVRVQAGYLAGGVTHLTNGLDLWLGYP